MANFCLIFKNSVAKQNLPTWQVRLCINQSAAIEIRAVIGDQNRSRSKRNTLYDPCLVAVVAVIGVSVIGSGEE